MMALVRIAVYVAIIGLRLYWTRGRRDDNWSYRALFLVLNLCAFVALAFALAGEPLALAAGVALVALAYPWWVARAVFVRLGMWRGAFAFGWMARVVWGADGDGAAVAAAWALHRQRVPSARGLEIVYRRIAASRFSSATVLASALLASARGDRPTARRLLESMGDLDALAHPLAHRLAGELLIADAAERGDWRRVRRLAASWEPSSRTTWFLGAVALRLTADPSQPSNATLVRCWLVAPNRRRTLPLLRVALATELGGSDRAHWPPPPDLDITLPADPLGKALALHLHINRGGIDCVELEDLVDLGRAWDEVERTGELATLAHERAADLESRDPQRVSREFLEEIESDIAAIVRQSGHRLDRLPVDSRFLGRAASHVREEMLQTIELALTSLEARTGEKSPLPPIDEWREFLELRALHAELARTGGIAVRQLAFPNLHHTLCNHAAWLWNERGEYVLGRAMFSWLLAEATVVGDSRAIELQRKNCDVAR